MSRASNPVNLGALDRETWARVQSILDRILDAPAEEASAQLTRLCGGDPELHALVQTLLRADERSGRFLETPVLEIATRLFDPDEGTGSSARSPSADDRAAGERIGPYRILHEIGRGGMGRVYLAERADGQFEQRVAIKLLKRGLDTDEILTRFLQERQILARLEHPHIARLVDGGATEDGLPWFALEHVEGAPITEYTRSRALSLPSVLALFLQACRAVQYAHRNLVVHRDLKPSNILVSERGEVKLLDFGIAKLLAEGEGQAEGTIGVLRLMTPIYAAPEQVRGEPPTTATDVYSLGVVLYELLTGGRPYRIEGRSEDQIRRAVSEEIPEAPSARLRREGDKGPRASWSRLVRGDLDNIVLQAMRKEPDGRYASAEALAEDIERYLEGRPVRASGRRFAYVAKKFVQRNRVGVAAAALLLVSLAAGLGGTAWQAMRAARERDRALLEAKKATEIKDFTLGLFSVSDPAQSQGASITARDLLERGTARANQELAGQPLVRAEMLTLLASVYYGLAEYARADSLAHTAVTLARSAGGPRSEQLAQSLHWFGVTRRGLSDFTGSKAALYEALSIRGGRGKSTQAYGETLSELGGTFRQSGILDSAEVCARKILENDRRHFGPDHEEIAADLDFLSVVLSDAGREEEALQYNRQALAIRERRLGHMHPYTANSISNLAFTLKGLGQYAEAESLLQEAIRIRLKILGPDHDDLATSYSTLAMVKREIGDYAGSIALYERTLAICRKVLPPDHPDIGRNVNNLAIVYYQRGLYPLALARFREALASRLKTLPPSDRGTLTMQNNIGCVLREMGRYAEAERIFREVRAARVKQFGAASSDAANSDHHLAILFHRTGRDVQAEAYSRGALVLRDSLEGHDHWLTAQSAEALATLLRDRGRYRESLPLYQRAVAINAKVYRHPSPQSADAWTGLGRLLLKLDRPREAETYLRKALPVRERAYGSGDPRTGEVMVALGLSRAAQGASSQAAPLLSAGIPALRRLPGRPDPLGAEGARALAALGRASDAR